MTTSAASVTHGSWTKTTASRANQMTRRSCPQQMMARPQTSKRGSKRSKEKSRSVNKDRRALKEVRAAAAEGGTDLKHIKKQVLGKFEAYWSTASKRVVSQPAEL